MDRSHVRSILLAALLGCTPVAFAGGGAQAADSHDRDAQTQPAGAGTLPSVSPPASPQQSGIGNISDVPGSMSDGKPAQTSNETPPGAQSLPPVLPRTTQNNSAIGNIEDVTGSMSDGSASKK